MAEKKDKPEASKGPVPSDDMAPPDASLTPGDAPSTIAPPANAQRVAPDSHEGTAELTRAVNAGEEAAEENLEEKHAADKHDRERISGHRAGQQKDKD
jgi:hypothetical protein